MNLSYLLGERKVGLWRITKAGTQVLGIADDLGYVRAPPVWPACTVERRRGPPNESDLAIRVAAYRLLATAVVEGSIAGQVAEVRAWEQPWVRSVWAPRLGKVVRVTLPAAASLVHAGSGGGWKDGGASVTGMLLLPDLGTAPILRYREAIRRLVALRAVQQERFPRRARARARYRDSRSGWPGLTSRRLERASGSGHSTAG